MQQKFVATPELLEKYSITKDVYLYSSNIMSGHTNILPAEKRTLEIRPGKHCYNNCIGCRDVRGGAKGILGKNKLNENDISLAANLLNIKPNPTDPQDRWRIILSGAQTEPLSSFGPLMDRIFEISMGQTLIVHTSTLNSNYFQNFIRKYLASGHQESGGTMVLTLSLNSPVYNLWSFGRDGEDADLHLRQNVAWYANQFGHNGYEYVSALHLYMKALENAQWLKGIMEAKDLKPPNFNVIAKQIIDLEVKPDYAGEYTRFSIDQTDSIERLQHAITHWTGIAHKYRVSPSYIYKLSERIPLQEKFDKWITQLYKPSEPKIDVAYRRFTAKPNLKEFSGVTRYQYTLGQDGHFYPCDYGTVKVSGLPRIDQAGLTKEKIDHAYYALKFPCSGCDHNTCTSDSYE